MHWSSRKAHTTEQSYTGKVCRTVQKEVTARDTEVKEINKYVGVDDMVGSHQSRSAAVAILQIIKMIEKGGHQDTF